MPVKHTHMHTHYSYTQIYVYPNGVCKTHTCMLRNWCLAVGAIWQLCWIEPTRHGNPCLNRYVRVYLLCECNYSDPLLCYLRAVPSTSWRTICVLLIFLVIFTHEKCFTRFTALFQEQMPTQSIPRTNPSQSIFKNNCRLLNQLEFHSLIQFRLSNLDEFANKIYTHVNGSLGVDQQHN